MQKLCTLYFLYFFSVVNKVIQIIDLKSTWKGMLFHRQSKWWAYIKNIVFLESCAIKTETCIIKVNSTNRVRLPKIKSLSYSLSLSLSQVCPNLEEQSIGGEQRLRCDFAFKMNFTVLHFCAHIKNIWFSQYRILTSPLCLSNRTSPPETSERNPYTPVCEVCLGRQEVRLLTAHPESPSHVSNSSVFVFGVFTVEIWI